MQFPTPSLIKSLKLPPRSSSCLFLVSSVVTCAVSGDTEADWAWLFEGFLHAVLFAVTSNNCHSDTAIALRHSKVLLADSCVSAEHYKQGHSFCIRARQAASEIFRAVLCNAIWMMSNCCLHGCQAACTKIVCDSSWVSLILSRNLA